MPDLITGGKYGGQYIDQEDYTGVTEEELKKLLHPVRMAKRLIKLIREGRVDIPPEYRDEALEAQYKILRDAGEPIPDEATPQPRSDEVQRYGVPGTPGAGELVNPETGEPVRGEWESTEDWERRYADWEQTRPTPTPAPEAGWSPRGETGTQSLAEMEDALLEQMNAGRPSGSPLLTREDLYRQHQEMLAGGPPELANFTYEDWLRQILQAPTQTGTEADYGLDVTRPETWPTDLTEEQSMGILTGLGLTPEQIAQYKSLGMTNQEIFDMVTGRWQGPTEPTPEEERQRLLDETLTPPTPPGPLGGGPDLSELERAIAAGEIPPYEWFRPGEVWTDPAVQARWQAEQGREGETELERLMRELGVDPTAQQGISEYELASLQQRQKELDFKKQQFGQLSASEEAELAWIRERFEKEQLAAGGESYRESRYRQQLLEWEKEQFTKEQEARATEQGISHEQFEKTLGATQDWRQWQIGEAGRQADVEQQNYLARMAAQPKSWLEYSAAAGETPAIQPWMLPMMPGQYAGSVAGAPIPGWGETPDMSQLPQLTNPSRQYQARMGPTGYQQYMGYQQATTGAPPQETDWRLWQTSPPSSTTPLVRRR